jgi:signal transduction histidine kinase
LSGSLLAARESFDAVLVDLPGSPSNAVERVLGVDPGAVVIALGDGDDESLATETIRAGAEEHLVKSVVTREMLAWVLKHAIERRRAQLARIQSRRLEAMGRMAFGMAHDFNNLLTVISGNAELALAELPEDQRSRQELEEIGEAAQRAALLTRQLLAFSRKQILKPVAVDLNALLQGMEKLLRRLIGEDISLGTKLEPGLGAINADPAQVEQVLMNLAKRPGRDAQRGEAAPRDEDRRNFEAVSRQGSRDSRGPLCARSE